MTVKEIIEYNATISGIIEDKTVPVSPLVKFRFLGLLKQFEPIVANFEKVRNDKIVELGTPEIDEDGNQTGNVSIDRNDTETIERLADELDKILELDSGIKIQKIKAEDIMDCGLSTRDLLSLYDLIES